MNLDNHLEEQLKDDDFKEEWEEIQLENELEKLRQEALAQTNKGLGCSGVIAILGTIVYFLICVDGFSFTSVADVIFLCIASFFVWVIAYILIDHLIFDGQFIKDEFEEKFKKKVVLTSLEKIFDDVTLNSKTGISYGDILDTNILKMENGFYADDYVKGIYKDVKVEFSNVCIVKEVDRRIERTGDDRHIHRRREIFRGQWFIFEFNRSFKTDVQICEMSFKNARKLFKSKRIKSDDIIFNKYFKVYAKDESEAFYILTPTLIERIKEVNEAIEGDLLFYFSNNKLHIGLYNCKNLFGLPNIRKRVNLKLMKEKLIKEIKIITDFIDTLNL